MPKPKLLKLEDLELPFEIEEEDRYYWQYTEHQLKEKYLPDNHRLLSDESTNEY